MRSRILFVAAFLALTVPLGAAGGQEEPATVPTDLALALINQFPDAYGSRAPIIIVGRAPEGLPSSITSLPFATVLGGLADSRGTLVVLKSTLPPNQVLTSFDKQLTAAGWGPPPPPPNENRGGFVASPSAGPFGNIYCEDSSAVTVDYSPAPQGGTYLKVRYSRDPQSSFCAPRHVRIMELPSLEFPRLLPPAGMQQRGGGSGRGGENVSTSAELMGPLAAVEVIPHYLKQLQAAGWKAWSLASSGDVSVASLEATDKEGKLWRGALLAQRVNENQLRVSIEMTRATGG